MDLKTKRVRGNARYAHPEKLASMQNLLIGVMRQPSAKEDLLVKCLIKPYVFSCPFMLLGLSRSGKTTYLTKYVYEWTKYNLADSKVTIVLLLTAASGTSSAFKALERYIAQNLVADEGKIFFLHIFGNFGSYISFYQSLQKKTSSDDWSGRIYCIVDDMPEAIHGNIDEVSVKTAEIFWNELVSRGAHSSTQLIFSVQSMSQIRATIIKSQIKIVIFFNLPIETHLKRMMEQVGAFSGTPLTLAKLKPHLSAPVDAALQDDTTVRDYRMYVYGITNNNSIVNFSYRVPEDFVNAMNQISTQLKSEAACSRSEAKRTMGKTPLHDA